MYVLIRYWWMGNKASQGDNTVQDNIQVFPHSEQTYVTDIEAYLSFFQSYLMWCYATSLPL